MRQREQFGLPAAIGAVVLSTLLALSAKGGELTDRCASHAPMPLASPDGRTRIEVNIEACRPFYKVERDGRPLLLPSRLGLVLSPPIFPLTVQSVSHAQKDEVIELAWGQHSQAVDRYAQMIIELGEADRSAPALTIEFRAYDDGLAFRYLLPAQEDFEARRIVQELSELNPADTYQGYAYRPEMPPLGPLPISDMDLAEPPLVLHRPGRYLAVLEAAVLETPPMRLTGRYLTLQVLIDPVDVRQGYQSAWRTLMIADTPQDLLTSELLSLLSPPSRVADARWIKPGKSLWDWRVRGATYDDFTYALNDASLRRFTAFAANNSIEYVMVDANWYGPEHDARTDPFTPAAGLHIESLIAEARSRGVGFILYLNDQASMHHDLDQLFETYAAWGAAGIKYGFMEAEGQAKVEKTLKIVELAAKHRLLINFHDRPIAPSGLRRTYPNWLTREFVHAQTDAGRSFTPSEFLAMSKVNMVAGPVDMSNGFYGLDGLKESRDYVRSEVYSTVAGETARALVVFSGLIILPDAPEEYARKSDLFEFIRRMPATWDDTQIPLYDPERHIVVARRSGSDWFIGAVTDEQGATLTLPLGFLTAGTTYEATIFADAPDAHYQRNREGYSIRKVTLGAKDSLRMAIAPGGGQAVYLTPN